MVFIFSESLLVLSQSDSFFISVFKSFYPGVGVGASRIGGLVG